MTKKEWKCLFLIICVFISACIETDIYLPAFPDMMRYFAVSEEVIQSLLTWNFIGICLSGPLYGPLSDSYGRKKPLLVALGLFLAGSLITVGAQSFGGMLLGRFLQGLGSGGCFTLGIAIVFDCFQAEKAVIAVNQLNSTVPIIIAGAPMLGGYLNLHYGFRWNFIAIAFFVAISFFISLFYFKEPLEVGKRVPFEGKKILHNFKIALTCLPFWQLTVIGCLIFAIYLTFLSSTALLYVLEFGVTKQAYPWFQLCLLGAWVIASLSCSALIKKWGRTRIKRTGTVAMLIGGGAFCLSTLFAPTNPYLQTGCMTLFSMGANWTQGLYFPESMELLSHIKGTAASLITSFRLLIAAVVIQTVGSFYDGTIYPVAITTALLLVTVIGTIFFYERGKLLRVAVSQ